MGSKGERGSFHPYDPLRMNKFIKEVFLGHNQVIQVILYLYNVKKVIRIKYKGMGCRKGVCKG